MQGSCCIASTKPKVEASPTTRQEDEKGLFASRMLGVACTEVATPSGLSSERKDFWGLGWL